VEGNAGIESSVRGAAAVALGALSTRLELLGSEFEEDRAWLARIVLVAVGAAFCLGVGLVLVALFVVMAVDPVDRLLALGAIAFGFVGAAVALALWVAAMTRRKPRLFSASAAELKLDAERLQPRTAP
jgi:uncharacterized membrane protein YqjE